MNKYTLLIGDCRHRLREIPDNSINTCVTSPPYFGLRDYEMGEQIGLEQTPEEYVSNLVDVFREVHRVLRDDGTLWLNLGDSYAGSGKGPAGNIGKGSNHGEARRLEHKHSAIIPEGLKRKDLIGIPWRVAFALQADGWYLRQDIIWSKPNPMPESVKDRCTKAHEYLFLLSKNGSYHFDSEAISEAATGGQKGSWASFKRGDSKRGIAQHGQAAGTHRPDRAGIRYDGKTRNKRSVWTVGTVAFKGAHFATFPPSLIEPCILAGSPIGGVVLDPFGGSGTTAGVSLKLGRSAIICELNPRYGEMVADRVASIAAPAKTKTKAQRAPARGADNDLLAWGGLA